MAFKDKYFLSDDIKVFPAAFRGTDGMTAINPEARMPTEYNLIHTGNIGKYGNKESFVLDYSNRILKCVIGGYYFEIKIKAIDLFNLTGKNFYINTKDITATETEVVGQAATQDTKNTVLTSFEGEQDLDTQDETDSKYYFTGLMFSAEAPTAFSAKLENVFSERGIINSENKLPMVNTGTKDNSITFGDKGDDKPIASGDASFAHGKYTEASGEASHAEGYGTLLAGKVIASGRASHAEGYGTNATGIASHAEGYLTTASRKYSHAEGKGTTADRENQTVVGKYNNIEDGEFIVGIGTGNAANSRKNALVVNGNKTSIYEELYVNALAKLDSDPAILQITSADSQINAKSIKFNTGTEHIDVASKLIKLSLYKDTTGTSRGKLVLDFDNNKTRAELNAANINLTGETTISDTLSVTKTAIIGEKLTVSNSENKNGADIFGDTTVDGKLETTSKLTVTAGGIEVTGASVIKGKTNLNGALEVGTDNDKKATILHGTLDVNGNTTIGSVNAPVNLNVYAYAKIGNATNYLNIAPNDASGGEYFSISSSKELIFSTPVNYNFSVLAGNAQFYTKSLSLNSTNTQAKFAIDPEENAERLSLDVYNTALKQYEPFQIKSSALKLVNGNNNRSVNITFNENEDFTPASGRVDHSFIYIKGDGQARVAIDKDCDIFTTGGIGTEGNISVGYTKITLSASDGKVTARSFNATSDKRLKKNLSLYTPERSILDLPIYKFDFISGSKNQIGCMAQDLQEICPELVDKTDSGLLTIQETKLVYLLLDEVKKLKEELKDLKK